MLRFGNMQQQLLVRVDGIHDLGFSIILDFQRDITQLLDISTGVVCGEVRVFWPYVENVCSGWLVRVG
jgi:hypothetical protein